MPRQRQIPRRLVAATAIAGVVTGLMPVMPVLAADPVTVNFTATGAEQQWTVPAGVSTIHVVLIGGRGGNSGGFGAKVTGDVTVTPGATLYVEVGGAGRNTGLGGAPGPAAFNGGASGGGSGHGGGGGGGASDVRTIARTDQGSNGSRLLVAGGGGGTGGQDIDPAGAGGAAGEPGHDAQGGGSGGGAGTASAGGAAGLPGGTAGSSGSGGAGGSIQSTITGAGGGGGGGYFGGGGGGSGPGFGSGGGGGGGSSFLGTASNASTDVDFTGVPSVQITYTPDDTPPDPTPGSDSGTVDADVTVPTSAACIELSTTSISFGTQRFGTEDALATPGITVTNCSGVDESLLAHVSAAAGDGATWTPINTPGTCDAGTLGIDEFHLKIRRPANEADPVTLLGADNAEIAELSGGADADLEALLDMPCAGSAGAGQTMGMNIVFVVTEIE